MSERVRSVTFELDDEDGGATLVVRARGGARPVCSCSIGIAAAVADAAPTCAHVRAAAAVLPELAASLEASRAAASATGARSTSSSPPNPAPAYIDAVLAPLRALIEALLRATAGEMTAAVDESLRGAADALATRPMPGVARVLDRVSSAVARADAAETALAITALAEVVKALEGAHGDDLRGEVDGAGVELGKLDDLDLVEVARVRDRRILAWETRLLVDIASGGLYREEAVVGARALSAGVCGRRVVASLAVRSAACEPPRVQLLHYQLEPAAAQSELMRAADAARKSVVVPERMKRSPLVHVACPHAAWLAPSGIAIDAQGATIADPSGARLALDAHRDPGAADVLARLVGERATVRALAGAFHVDVDGVRLQPWSVLVERDAKLELVPLAV